MDLQIKFTRQPFTNEEMVLIFQCLGEPPGTNMVRV